MQILQDWLKETTTIINESCDKVDSPLQIMSGLRELQLRLNPLFFAKIDPKTRFVAYFLINYIDNIFMDLFGDTPDDGDCILRDARDEFFKNLIKYLNALLESLGKKDDPLPALEGLVESYTEAVNFINFSDKK